MIHIRHDLDVVMISFLVKVLMAQECFGKKESDRALLCQSIVVSETRTRSRARETREVLSTVP